MKKIYFMAIVAALAVFGGCSTTVDGEGDVNIAKSELSIGLPIGINRTAIDEEGKASWVEGDTFALWAENRTGALVLNGVDFRMMYYWHSLQSAVFTSNANAISDGTYTYYAVAPVPESVNGSKATYSIPAEQQGGSFNGAYDIMVAKPLEAGAVVADKVNNLALDFQHKMHILKITIAENNLGIDISKLQFTFPAAVTGSVTVDTTDPEAAATLSNGSQQLTVNCPEGLSVGETAWGVIFPQNISGDIKLTAVGVDGRLSMEKSISLSKECAASHITPLLLTVPTGRSTLRFSIGTNNLGEDIQKLTIIDNNGSSITFDKSATNTYDYSVDSSSTTVFDHYEGKTFTATFESANAIVSTTFVMPSNLSNGVNVIPALTVPYLFFEDFSCIHTAGESYGDNDKSGGDERKQPGSSLDSYMGHTGWNAARFMLGVGTCPRINVRYQMVNIAIVQFTTTHRGRLDTPPISTLKSGANVTVRLMFDAGGVEYNGNYTSSECMNINVTTHTNNNNPLDGVATGTLENGDISNFGTKALTKLLPANYTLDSFSSVFPTHSTNISNITNATRICFYPDITFSTDGIGDNNECAVYIDNIKVQIVQ